MLLLYFILHVHPLIVQLHGVKVKHKENSTVGSLNNVGLFS